VKMFDGRKTGMIGLPYGGKTMTIRYPVFIQYQRVTDRQTDGRTDGRTDRQTDRIAISILRVSSSMLTRDNNINNNNNNIQISII